MHLSRMRYSAPVPTQYIDNFAFYPRGPAVAICILASRHKRRSGGGGASFRFSLMVVTILSQSACMFFFSCCCCCCCLARGEEALLLSCFQSTGAAPAISGDERRLGLTPRQRYESHGSRVHILADSISRPCWACRVCRVHGSACSRASDFFHILSCRFFLFYHFPCLVHVSRLLVLRMTLMSF